MFTLRTENQEFKTAKLISKARLKRNKMQKDLKR